MKLTNWVPLSLLALAACTNVGPSPQLVDARRAYDIARTSPEANYTPSSVLGAVMITGSTSRAVAHTLARARRSDATT